METSDGIANVPFRDPVGAYDRWIASLGVPVHEGYFIPDVRTIEVARWEERGCNAAFLKLTGLEGVSEARVSELDPGATTPPVRLSYDEAVYVVEGRGLTTLWREDGGGKTTFEWQKHSLFLLPRHYTHQFSNAQGNRAARLLHYNYLPLSMQAIPDPEFFVNNPYLGPAGVDPGVLYSDAKLTGASDDPTAPGGGYGHWVGNFFPDMRAWDKLAPYKVRGAGGHAVYIRFASARMTGHMSVFPAKTYKKAHRHGPGVVIVIPAGEGFSVMWPEGQDKVFIPWQEGSVFVPPNRWFHQHFNVGGAPGRYLAFHSPPGLNNYSERVEDLARDQIEYPNEDPWIRQTFEAELAKRNLSSIMPDEAYRDASYQWSYTGEA